MQQQVPSVAVIVLLLIVGTIITTGILPLPQGAYAQNSSIDAFLTQSFTDVLSAATAHNCTEFTEGAACNATLTCNWNNTIANNDLYGGPAFACRSRTLFYNAPYYVETVGHSWCYAFFPLWVLAPIFFSCAFLGAVAFVGVVYSFLHYDVYSTRLESGETVFNQFYYKTTPIILYCLILFASCAILAITAWLYWLDETICAYVPMTIVYLIVVAVFIIGYPAYRLFLHIQEKCQDRKKLHFDIDEHIMPQTRQAIPARANQVRCF